MANISRKGFFPKRYLNGAPYNGQANTYYIPSSDGTATFIGDLVKIAGSADADTGRPTVTQCAAAISTNVIVGAVVGIDQVRGIAPSSVNLLRKHRPASTAMYVEVCDDPYVVYQAQGNTTVALNDIGLNADIIVGTGSTTTGISGMEVDNGATTAMDTTATLPIKLVGFVPEVDNEFTSTNAKLEVMINDHFVKFGTVGV